jgi:hypothetical protein
MCLDSSTATFDALRQMRLAETLQALNVGGMALVPGRLAREMIETPGLLCGFDQVAIVASDAPTRSVLGLQAVCITTDAILLDGPPGPDIERALRRAGASCLLGDGTGIGLNYITVRREWFLVLQSP